MLKVGIIGTGLIARQHADAIASLSHTVTLVAAADISAQPLDDFAKTFAVPRRYRASAELIADSQMDLVVIAAPPAAHEKLAIQALEAGKYVLCEKPLAQSLASAERIAAQAAKYAGRISICYQLRVNPQIRRMLWLIRHGFIGDVREAQIERHGFIPHTRFGRDSWWGVWDTAGGGVLITQMIHEVDIMLQAMGGEPRSITAKMDTRFAPIQSEDWIDAIIRFDGGRAARCVGSINSGKMTGGFTFRGSLGEISPGKLQLHNSSQLKKALDAVDAALPDTKPLSRTFANRIARKLGDRLRGAQKAELSDHAMIYREIAKNIAAGLPLPVPPGEAIKSLTLCMGVYAAALSGKELELSAESLRDVREGVSLAVYDARPRTRAIFHASEQTTSTKLINGRVRVGLIGLDTTHATTFTDLLHNPYNPFHIPGACVVAAYPGGSLDMDISISRVAGFVSELQRKYGVRIMDTPEAVADVCDLVFILASDGRLHPGLFKTVAGRGRPVFIDKPFAISAHDAREIFEVARNTRTPVFGWSGFRYCDDLVAALNQIRDAGEKVKSCVVRCWLPIQPTQGRYFWYGIHGAEMLVASVGDDIDEVEASAASDQDVIIVRHSDSRESRIIGSQSDNRFLVKLETQTRQFEIDLSSSMASMPAHTLWSALDVLTEGHFPRLWRATPIGSVAGPRPSRAIDPTSDETVKIICLLDAAQRSYASGKPISLGSL